MAIATWVDAGRMRMQVGAGARAARVHRPYLNITTHDHRGRVGAPLGGWRRPGVGAGSPGGSARTRATSVNTSMRELRRDVEIHS